LASFKQSANDEEEKKKAAANLILSLH